MRLLRQVAKKSAQNLRDALLGLLMAFPKIWEVDPLRACLAIPPFEEAKVHMHQATGSIRRSLAPCGRSAGINQSASKNAHKGLDYERLAPGV